MGDTVRVVFTQDGASCTYWILVTSAKPSIFPGSYVAFGEITEIDKKTALACELLELAVGDNSSLSYEIAKKGNKGRK